MPAVSQKRELSPLDEEPRSKMEPSCKPQSSDACHIVNSLCLLILSGRMKENKSATSNQQVLIDITNLPVYIEVYGKATDDNNDILIEKWLIQSVLSQCESNIAETAAKTSIQFLSQAVKSFLYFSQINSWTVSNGGELPFHLQHRVHATNSTDPFPLQFSSPTETHNFPLVPIDSISQYINISVTYLSRLEEIPSQLLPDVEVATALTNISIDKGSILKNPPLTEAVVSIQPAMINTSSDDCTNQLVIAETNNTSSLLLLPNDSLENSENSGFPFSPPNPSPLSHKCIPNLNQNSTKANTIHQLTCPINIGQSTISNDCTDISCQVEQLSLTSSDHKNSSNGSGETHSDCNSRTSSSASRIIISKLNKASSTSNNITKTISVNGNTKLNNPLHNMSVSRYTGMRPSGASSPIPFQFRRNSCVDSTDKALKKKLKRRSCGVYSKSTSCPPPPTRSMSLPAVVPNLCLLGTFEESVLNGRIEPLGYVEGFTAELGASGSFCPQHVTLPVTTSFFSLSDDGGPSQYLGHIDLSGLKKRGYHIPRMGTVQLTLFNPNKTVVKIFVIIYDHSDMPPNTTTFIRQKTQSRPSYDIDGGIVKELVLPSLQYLIHLRFLSSKSGHVYLHTDIKILFARRAPDTDPDLSKVSLYTMLEGPCNPKYGPLTKELC